MNTLIYEMAESNAIDHGDPVLTTDEASRFDGKVLERYAAIADGPVKGTGFTKMELIAYFARQTTLNDYIR